MVGDFPTFKDIKFQITGYTKVVGTSFGFIMFRNDLLGERPFMHDYKGMGKSVDISYGLKLRDLGYSVNYAWEIDIWHYYKTKEGLVGSANRTNHTARTGDKNRETSVQIKNIASPIFIRKVL
jgi:hypothetical protein